MTTIFIGVLSLATLGAVSAKPQFLVTLVATYPTHASTLQQRSCSNCHTTVGDFSRNAYGKELESLVKQSGGTAVTPAILKQAESASPAPGGPTFGALINDDKALDGTATLTAAASPAATPATPPAPAQPSAGDKTATSPSFPTNAEHPALVHFPIALFISGLFLDILGFARKDKSLLMAGWYDLVLAAVSSLAAVATGLAALFMMQIPLVGIIRLHMLGALISTVLMWSLVGLRAYKHERLSTPGRVAYYILAAANLVIISAVGHLGGQFVYG
jgi:uncharacterized membrane protein